MVLVSLVLLAIGNIFLVGCEGEKPGPKLIDLTDRDCFYLEGVVIFDQDVDSSVVGDVLRDLFYRYIRIDFSVENKNGVFTGTVDTSLHARPILCVLGSDIEARDDYYQFKQFCGPWSYYYKIRCDRLSLTDSDGIPYRRLSILEHLNVNSQLYKGAGELAGRNHIQKIMFDKVSFGGSGRIHLHKFFDFQ